MQAFLDRHADRILGVLEGYDRLLFRGCLRSISYVDGLDRFLGAQHIRYDQFAGFAQRLSQQLHDHAQAIARQAGRPFEYVCSGQRNKEQIALKILQRDGITDGLICVLRCVEPCMSFSIRRRDGHPCFVREQRKCLFFYFYYLDRGFGLMHIRLQSWLPFDVQVCLNGRDYLACQMKRRGIGFEQRDNCFTRIDDLPQAQELMRRLERRKWQRLLNAMVRRVNPLPGQLQLFGYYWSIRESEYATDVMFRDARSLDEIYPALVEHAMRQMNCQDIMRFLGRRTSPGRFRGEASAQLRRRSEGVRVKHWIEENSMKMYNKQQSVLRIETTLNNVRRFKVLRSTVQKRRRSTHWLPMRKGIVDLPRRTQLARAANERYLQALGVVGEPSPTRHLFDPVSRRITDKGRPYRALRPISVEEARVFQVLLDGRYQLKGFSNAQVRRELGEAHGDDPRERRRKTGRMTRFFRLLRAHHLIGKLSHTHRYRVTDLGQRVMSAALKVRNADVAKIAA